MLVVGLKVFGILRFVCVCVCDSDGEDAGKDKLEGGREVKGEKGDR